MIIHRLIMCIVLICFAVAHLKAQNKQELNKIAASQGTASPLLFAVDPSNEELIQAGDFKQEDECIVRGGIPNFMMKVKNREDVTVAFIGGSLTQAEYCYRKQISTYLQAQYPKVKFKWVNAGVAGTGTDLGAFRIQEQVLSQAPDLIFIEFAVNGAYVAGIEGMIRQIIQHDPNTDICLTHAMLGMQTAIYRSGKIPIHIQRVEALARHYHIPTVHMGMEIACLESQSKLLWKGNVNTAGRRILFSEDGIHPLKAGGNLYAAAIARGIGKMTGLANRTVHVLPTPLITDEWEYARMYRPAEIADFDVDWTAYPTEQSKLKAFKGWFDTLMVASRAGASYSFSFDGDLFGLFDIGGPEVGQLEVWVDGRQIDLEKHQADGLQVYQVADIGGVGVVNRFNTYCNNRYRGQYDVVRLVKGIHEVTFRISSLKADKKTILGPSQQDDILLHPDKYDASAIYLGRILLRGKPLTKMNKKYTVRTG